MTWFIFSLFSIGALAMAELTQQKLLNGKDSFDERTSTVLTVLVQTLIAVPIILLTDLKYSIFAVFTAELLPYILLVSMITSFAMIYYLKSFKVKNISISTVFVSLSVVTSTALGILYFGEGFYSYKILGILLVLIAVASLNINNLQLEKNHLYGLLAGLLFGVAYTIDKKVVLEIHPIIYLFWSFMFLSLLTFFINPKPVLKSLSKTKLFSYQPIILSGLGYFFYNFFTFTAYAVGGEVGRVDAINNSQVFIIILVEFFVFKHTEGLLRKLITAGIAFIGVMILGFL